MAIYKLAPQEGKESHKDWRASSIPPMAVWVRADHSSLGRLATSRATRGMYFAGRQAGQYSSAGVRWSVPMDHMIGTSK